MANRFWNFVVQMTAGTLAKAEDVNVNLSGINTGLDSVSGELDQSIQVTNSPGTTFISLNTAARSLKILTFNASGDVVAVDDMGDWQGDHAGSTDYNERDIVKDAAGDIGLNNIYRANTSFTSNADMAVDSANWDLVINVVDVETAKVAAEAAQAAAELAETGAENQLILFTGQYYGPRTTAQETNLDPNGSASTDGDIYFNTDLNRMKVFNGTTWQLTTANAVDVSITDAGSYYAAANVEAALQEIVVRVGELNTKVIEIGTWDMVTTLGVSIAHGLTLSKIRTISVILRNDTNTGVRILPTPDPGGTTSESIACDSSDVLLTRATNGFFDGTGYDTMGDDGNRGWITIQYTD